MAHTLLQNAVVIGLMQNLPTRECGAEKIQIVEMIGRSRTAAVMARLALGKAVDQHQPAGFPHYRGGSASFSATVNKFLREKALLHKSAERRVSPFPGRTYPTASVTGMPSAV